MKENIPFETARTLMLSHCRTIATEFVDISESYGRVIAEDIYANTDIPPFHRSQFDGYAFKASDTFGASKGSPVILDIIEEIPAGSFSAKTLSHRQAVKILTGAPIPTGADTVVKYETTEFTTDTVTIFSPAVPGDFIPAGEDVEAGSLIVESGEVIDSAIAGMLTAQGITTLKVFKKPVAAIISTGAELVEADCDITPGKIRNTNRYTLEAACHAIGLSTSYIGTASDKPEEIALLINQALLSCDIIFVTGGVSVGDYDLTPKALESIGADILVRAIDIKPGGACAFAEKDAKLIFCLSGSPAAAMLNFYAVAFPVLRKLRGLNSYIPQMIKVHLSDDYKKPSQRTRFLFGSLSISNGTAQIVLSENQRNNALRSMAHANLVAIVPKFSPPLPKDFLLDAFFIN